MSAYSSSGSDSLAYTFAWQSMQRRRTWALGGRYVSALTLSIPGLMDLPLGRWILFTALLASRAKDHENGSGLQGDLRPHQC
ncbi:MAG: hypothetical protein NT074_01945 [Methanomicrobiales archaeon]|nr:hypothetical protein [Methanomicrobiales archaeon]